MIWKYLYRISGNGRTELMRRVSRASRRTTPTATPSVTPKKTRKSSVEGMGGKPLAEDEDTLATSLVHPLVGPIRDKKLKRTNMMKRRESQALLEGVRKNRLNGNLDLVSSENNSSASPILK